jgi:hypothetical protein
MEQRVEAVRCKSPFAFAHFHHHVEHGIDEEIEHKQTQKVRVKHFAVILKLINRVRKVGRRPLNCYNLICYYNK